MGVLNNIAELHNAAKYCRTNNLIVGLCHGCFDIVHPGHIYHLKRARTMVDRLFVSITADNFVNKDLIGRFFLTASGPSLLPQSAIAIM
ncbi:adenylyltransferase/cytidyltransferase family protein [Pseudomonas sp. PCH199]|uniref:adenylyltransferase/cytidyltransferase family protein n=1 Tax=unclassified Pseudomonas TaxID=196821 RepID=UPI000BD3A840|nr:MULTISPECIES: adenylyltransferase/cytidyltransferase family protein [unclassified Pseudomonas]MCW8276874.1 adenylyltransferase/cytidyltransferase family protein [Pseudomonas sp. PCH199]PAM82725.1 hypothetical protein CES87_15620 [Pseudomonas sp. ERMR1:02]